MIKIRPAALTDYPRLAAYDEFLGDRRIDLQAGALRVADFETTKAIGYTQLVPNGFLGWPLLAILCVDPAFRRQGAGRALVQDATADARFLRLYVTTEADNAPMQTLLAQTGAEAIGHVDSLNMSGARELLYRLK